MAEKEIKHAGSDRVKRSYFDKSRREEYTILIPDMLPIHFKLSWQYTKNTAITWSFCKTAHETL